MVLLYGLSVSQEKCQENKYKLYHNFLQAVIITEKALPH